MGLWSYLIPEGGKRMTLIELSINMSKTASATTCTFQTDWNSEVLYFSSGDPYAYATHRPTYFVATATADRIRSGRARVGENLRLTSCQLPFGLSPRASARRSHSLYLNCPSGRT